MGGSNLNPFSGPIGQPFSGQGGTDWLNPDTYDQDYLGNAGFNSNPFRDWGPGQMFPSGVPGVPGGGGGGGGGGQGAPPLTPMQQARYANLFGNLQTGIETAAPGLNAPGYSDFDDTAYQTALAGFGTDVGDLYGQTVPGIFGTADTLGGLADDAGALGTRGGGQFTGYAGRAGELGGRGGGQFTGYAGRAGELGTRGSSQLQGTTDEFGNLRSELTGNVNLSPELQALAGRSDLGGDITAQRDIAAGTDPRFDQYAAAQREGLNTQRTTAIEEARGRLQRSGVEGTALENELAKINQSFALRDSQLMADVGMQQMNRQDMARLSAADLTGRNVGLQSGLIGQRSGQAGTEIGIGSGLVGQELAGRAGALGFEAGQLGQEAGLGGQGLGFEAGQLGQEAGFGGQGLGFEAGQLGQEAGFTGAQGGALAQGGQLGAGLIGQEAGLAGTGFGAGMDTTRFNNQNITDTNQSRQVGLENLSNLLGIDTARLAAERSGMYFGGGGGKK